MNSTLEIDMEMNKSKSFLIAYMYAILFLLSSVPFNITYYFVRGTNRYNAFYAEIIDPFCNILTIVLFYPMLNLFSKVILISRMGVTYVVTGTILYFIFGYGVNLLLNRIGIKKTFLKIIIGLVLLPIFGLIYAPFAPSIF